MIYLIAALSYVGISVIANTLWWKFAPSYPYTPYGYPLVIRPDASNSLVYFNHNVRPGRDHKNNFLTIEQSGWFWLRYWLFLLIIYTAAALFNVVRSVVRYCILYVPNKMTLGKIVVDDSTKKNELSWMQQMDIHMIIFDELESRGLDPYRPELLLPWSEREYLPDSDEAIHILLKKSEISDNPLLNYKTEGKS